MATLRGIFTRTRLAPPYRGVVINPAGDTMIVRPDDPAQFGDFLPIRTSLLPRKQVGTARHGAAIAFDAVRGRDGQRVIAARLL